MFLEAKPIVAGRLWLIVAGTNSQLDLLDVQFGFALLPPRLLEIDQQPALHIQDRHVIAWAFRGAATAEAGEHFTPRDVVKLMADLILLPLHLPMHLWTRFEVNRRAVLQQGDWLTDYSRVRLTARSGCSGASCGLPPSGV